jgi:hypothetical protein
MQFSRRSLSFAGLSLVAMAVLFAACTEDGQSPAGPGPLPPPIQPPTEMVAIDCKASVKRLGMECLVPRPDAGGARGVFLGSQNVNVKLSSNDLAVVADTFAFDINIQNILRQPTSGLPQRLGVDSLGVTHPIQVFFHEGPVAVGPGGGSVDVPNADGSATFIENLSPYFNYPVVLDSGQVSPDKRWKLKFSPEVDSLFFRVIVSARVPRPEGWVDVSPDTALLVVDSTVTFTGVARNHVGNVVPGQTITWSSSNTAVATVNASTGQVTAVATGTAVITASTSTPGRYGTSVVVVSAKPSVVTATYDAIENVTATVAVAQGLKTKITDPDGDAKITGGTFATAQGGTVTVDSAGSFQYSGKGGFDGTDSFTYEVKDGVTTVIGTVNMTVAPSNYWYVKAGAVSGDAQGNQRFPFATVTAAQAAAVGPESADSIFVLYAGATQLDDAVVLESGQSLIGEGITLALVATINSALDTILGNAGASGIARTTAGPAVTLSTNNLLRGLGITAANGAAITGSGFGTLTASDLGVNPAGPALHLTNGTLAASFGLLSSTGSATEGLFLSGVGGTLTAAPASSLQNAAGRLVDIVNGTADITFPGAISGAGEGISLTGNTAGTVTFGGALTLTRKGIAAQTNTGGTFAFTGATKTIDVDSTTNAGVTLATNTGATFQFGGGSLAISTAGGTGFSATGGGTVTVTGANNTVTTTSGTAVVLNGVGTGAPATGVTFATVSASAATTGISLNTVTGAGFQVTGTGAAGSGGTINASGNGVLLASLGATPVVLTNLNVTGSGAAAAFSAAGSSSVTVADVSVIATAGPALSLATSTLNGTFSSLNSSGSASSAVILNTAAGAFTAAAGTLAGTAGGPAIAVIGGSVDFIDFGSVSQAANAALLSVTATHTGDLNFNGAVSATGGTGLQFADADGSYLFNAATTLNGGDAGVDVTGGSAGTFTFASATITNPTGVALNVAASAPTLSLAGTVTNNNGRAVVVDGLTGGLVSVSAAVNSASPGTGILVQNNTGGTTEFIGGGTLSTGAAHAVTLSGNNTAATIRFAGPSALAITTTTGTGFNADGGGTLAVTGAGSKTVSSTGGTAVRILNTKIDGVGGAVFQSVTASGGANGIVLQNTTTGVFGVQGGTISGTTGAGVQLTSTAFATLNNLSVTAGTAGAAIAGTTFGTLTVGNTTVTAGTGPALALTTGALTGTFASVGGTVTGAVKGVVLAAVTDSFTVSGGTLVGGSDSAVVVRGGTVAAGWSGTVSQANNFPLLAVTGTHQTGTVGFTGAITATNGTGLQFNDADGRYRFTGNVSMNGGDAGIDVANGSNGEFSFSANTNVNNPTGSAITVQNSTGGLNFTYSGLFTKNNNSATGILVQNNAGGNVTFNGATKLLSTGTATAVNLASNGSTSILFAGGGLNITTTSGSGFSATGGGTVQVTSAPNTVTSTTGTAVNIQNTTIGAGNVTFQSVSASGGANGIVLNNTGTGGFSVTGTGALASGGTIVNTTGGDGAVSGNGVYLNNARSVSLAYMNFSGHGNHAVRGLEVTGFTMDRVRITGTNGTNVAGEGEGGVYFHGLYGSASITRSYIEGGVLDNVRVVNTSGTLDRLVMNNDTIGHNGNTGSDGVFLQADVSAVFKATIQNSRFTGSRGDQTQMSARGLSNVDFVYTGNTLTNNHPAALPQNFGVAISSGGLGAGYNPTVTYNVSNNVINDIGSTGISIGKGGVGAGSFTGTVNGNQIGTAGVANSGSAQGSAIVVDIVGGGSHTSTITNNTIRQFTNYGILAQSGNTTAGGGQGYMTLTIRGNNIAQPSPASASALFPTSGIRVVTGTNAGDTSKNCVVLGGTVASEKNVVTGTGTNGGSDLRLFERFTTILGVPGYAGASNDNAAMDAFLTARNTLTTVSATNNVAAGGPGFSGTCPA